MANIVQFPLVKDGKTYTFKKTHKGVHYCNDVVVTQKYYCEALTMFMNSRRN